MADFFLESWHEGTLLLDQSQPPVCLGPAFTHLIQADQWPSLKFEGNSTRQLLQSVWFNKKSVFLAMREFEGFYWAPKI